MPATRKPAPSGTLKSIAVVGMGRWGSSFCAALIAHGITPVEVVGRVQKAGQAVPVISFKQARFDAEVLWLCVPDGEIAAVVDAVLAKRASLRGQIVVHSSGVSSSVILAAAAKAGALIASVHPLMTFPTRKAVSLVGVPFAIEAHGAMASRLAKLVRQLGGRPFRLPAEGKALYHASAVMASPLLVSLATAARQAAMLAGLTGEQANVLLEPIMVATIRNFFREGGARSFSGPFARGDVKTVSLHLEALQVHPSLQAVYMALAGYATEELPVVKRRALAKALATAKPNILSEASQHQTAARARPLKQR